MTRWVEEPSGGRDRGPRALARAWIEVLVRPRRFFRTGVAPGDQAPGLAFAMAVVLLEEASRAALVPGAIPRVTGDPVTSTLVVLAVAVLLVTPAALHLVAGGLTVGLMALLEERAGVSETVQVVAYAAAPCALAGAPIPALRAACCAYGAALLAVGIAVVHDAPPARAALASAVPAAVVFGYGFRGFDALARLAQGI